MHYNLGPDTFAKDGDRKAKHIGERGHTGGARAPLMLDLRGSRMTALTSNLEIVIPKDVVARGVTFKKKRNEIADFTLYLNYATANLREITGVMGEDEAKIADQLKNLPEAVLERLADFLWGFRFDEPGRDFSGRPAAQKVFDHDYRRLAPKLALKVFELRNYFVHCDRTGNEPLVCDRDLYVLLEGVLRPIAEAEGRGPRCQADKLYQMHLMNLRGRFDQPMDGRRYDLTRRGVMFIVCLALYKDDAEEFLSCFADMRLPSRRRDEIDKEMLEESVWASTKAEIDRKKPKKRALVHAFTYFSYRRGRVSVDGEAPDFLNFANIIGYLNKVPRVSHDYLSLEEERAVLAELERKSTESAENRAVKYDLAKQIRAKDRFVSLAAAWCEDFEVLPCLRFKRLDITPSMGRKRYGYGKDEDNAVRLGRHYAIEDGAIRFEWRARDHVFGPIHVKSLRSCVGEVEFRHLLCCALRSPKDTNAALDRYFAAYHAVLEILLNTSDVTDLNVFGNTALATAVETVVGQPLGTLFEKEQEDICAVLGRHFPKNVWRFFIQTEARPSDEELRYELEKRLYAQIGRCEDFLTRVGKLRRWVRENGRKEPESRAPFPRCGKRELLNPPRECRVSDASCAARVMEFLDYNLAADRKFRQLALGDQHNTGMRDFEYQIVQRAIGKFSLDNSGFWGGICKGGEKDFAGIVVTLRPELAQVVRDLRRETKSYPKGRMGYTLLDLASAAATLMKRTCERLVAKGPKLDGAVLRQFKVRTGLPFSHDAIVRSVLGIDMERWQTAFDRENGHPYRGRALADVEHVVSQVPLPNGLADRLVCALPRVFGGDGEGKVDWSRLFGSLDARNGKLSLRDYYDTSALVRYVHDHSNHADEHVDPSAPGINPWTDADPRIPRPDFSRGGINKAIRSIKTVHNQDRLLLAFAQEYWKQFVRLNASQDGKARFDEATSVRDFFTEDILRPFNGGKAQLVLSQNDVFSPTYAHVTERVNARTLHDILAQQHPGETRFHFSEVAQLFARKQRECRRLRLELLPRLDRFAERCPIPKSAYDAVIATVQDEKPAVRSTAVRTMEYEKYRRVFPSLTREQYELVADVRNEVMHRNILVVDDEKIQELRTLLTALRC